MSLRLIFTFCVPELWTGQIGHNNYTFFRFEQAKFRKVVQRQWVRCIIKRKTQLVERFWYRVFSRSLYLKLYVIVRSTSTSSNWGGIQTLSDLTLQIRQLRKYPNQTTIIFNQNWISDIANCPYYCSLQSYFHFNLLYTECYRLACYVYPNQRCLYSYIYNVVLVRKLQPTLSMCPVQQLPYLYNGS